MTVMSIQMNGRPRTPSSSLSEVLKMCFHNFCVLSCLKNDWSSRIVSDPCTSGLCRWIKVYAADQGTFFNDFTDAYTKLVGTGARWDSMKAWTGRSFWIFALDFWGIKGSPDFDNRNEQDRLENITGSHQILGIDIEDQKVTMWPFLSSTSWMQHAICMQPQSAWTTLHSSPDLKVKSSATDKLVAESPAIRDTANDCWVSTQHVNYNNIHYLLYSCI